MPMITSHVFGHEVLFDKDSKIWRYSDDGEPCTPSDKSRKCPKCNKYPTEKGHDPCIANLPGVEYACCGHGQEIGYVSFINGKTIRGIFDEED